MPGVHEMVTHTKTILQLNAVGLFNYKRTFSGQQALTSYIHNDVIQIKTLRKNVLADRDK